MTQKVYAILAVFLLTIWGMENNAHALIEISNDTGDSIQVTFMPNVGKHVGCEDKHISLGPHQEKHVHYSSTICQGLPINAMRIEGPKGKQVI